MSSFVVSETGQTNCTDCSPGTFSKQTGAESCTPCNSGNINLILKKYDC